MGNWMKGPLSIPPASHADLSPGDEIARRLAPLIGKPFQLTGKTRTDGSNLRKTVARVLEESAVLPTPAPDGAWRIVPPKRKGVPRLLREFVDTFIVTSGTSYNLQVWNRNPSQPTPQIEYADGSLLRANDVRLIFVRIDVAGHKIRSIVVATPEYVVEHFGKFGKETVKEQLIILPRARQQVLSMKPAILFYPDEGASSANGRSRWRFSTALKARPSSTRRTHDARPLDAERLSNQLVDRRFQPPAIRIPKRFFHQPPHELDHFPRRGGIAVGQWILGDVLRQVPPALRIELVLKGQIMVAGNQCRIRDAQDK